MKHFKTWDAKSWTKNIISEMWWLPKLENKFYCVHVLEDQWTKSWKDKPIIQLSTIFERPGRWSQLRQAWVVRLGFKPWTFEEFTCIMLVIMFVSARLERPSLEVYLRFTTVPNPNNSQTCKMTKSEFHFQLPHFNIYHQEQHHNIEIEGQEKPIVFLLGIWNL